MTHLRRPKKPKAAADQAAAFGTHRTAGDTAKLPPHRPEFQGLGNARPPKMQAPRWEPPKGSAGLAALEALWGPPRRLQRRGRR